MKIVGLTGSIGMGKSVAAAMLQQMGIPVFDSDRSAHEFLSPNGAAFEQVALEFPECWDKKKHIIDRKKLGQIIFNDPWQRQKLESIVHPLVWWKQKEFLKAAKSRGSKIAVLDIPLLFETGAEKKCDAVLCVDAPYFIQRQRVLGRPDMNEDKFYAILSQQMPQIEKLQRADIIIKTGLGRADTYRQLKTAVSQIIKIRKVRKA
ncbi:MAG TPA: dephospho-CoA kinase [Alphaproteobacteria bacterium]|jgi:dephospho-CoA kinase|nr:dephospho-CoA kinase [Alphaproteobacteria bacterium]MCB9985803.1 dephospho-CoA kinase [Micavibrio sp.]HPQ50055.1 dephospho-CoA kinase [Alphaproteobacteria bacterium]HRK97564.1 dephospho-CoA kinase [Alphaproteobacteria bacterium]